MEYIFGFVACVVQYQRLLQDFEGKSVRCGTLRTEQPPGSLGEWLMGNVTRTAITSYVGRILVCEGYAKNGS